MKGTLRQKCDCRMSARAVTCARLRKERGDPRRQSYFWPLELCSCLLTWQILGDSPCFLSSLMRWSGKARPHRPCQGCGNGDRPGGGGGDTGRQSAEPSMRRGKRAEELAQAGPEAGCSGQQGSQGRSRVPSGSARPPPTPALSSPALFVTASDQPSPFPRVRLSQKSPVTGTGLHLGLGSAGMKTQESDHRQAMCTH